MHRLLLILAAAVAFTACTSSSTTGLSNQEKDQLLGPKPDPSLKWSKVKGADFTVYHGIPADAKSGEIGFYVGHAPSFHPEPGSTLHNARLGDIGITWHRKKHDDGSYYETTLVHFADKEAIHVWIYAASADELKKREQQISQLAWFTQAKPKE